MIEYKQYLLRIDIKDFQKINYIAEYNRRSNNKQIEHIIRNYIKDFEKINGNIEIPENN